jgi:antitoxin FitA
MKRLTAILVETMVSAAKNLRGDDSHAISCSQLEPNRMPTNLSIKNAPDDIVARLKRRAAEHHRSLQGELLAILEEAVSSSRRLTPTDVLAEVKRLGLRTPAEAVEMIRADRDGR